MKNKKQYDEIAKEYDETIGTNLKIYGAGATLFNALGNIKNLKILDLACGSGYFTRLIKKKGAKEVVGVDISNKIIEIARDRELQNALGIEYLVGDVTKMNKIDDFDIVVATYLLHYASSEEELGLMCNNIYKNLKKKGKFLSINLMLSPQNLILKNSLNYQIKFEAPNRLKNGELIKVTLFPNTKKVSFNCYHWDKEIYEASLEKAGFKNIKWHKPIVSKEGIKKYGKQFWESYLENPSSVVLECYK